jgi:hypothetical protein
MYLHPSLVHTSNPTLHFSFKFLLPHLSHPPIVPLSPSITPDPIPLPLSHPYCRERLRLKQELIKKQRADKEKDDTDKSENNSPRDIAPVSKIGLKLSEKSEEIQMKMDKLKADILKNQAAKDEEELNNKKGNEQRISRTKSFSDDSSSSEDEGEKKVEVKAVEKTKIEVKGKGEKKEDLESVEDYDSDEQNDIDERNFNQKILDKNKIMNNNVNTSVNSTVNMNKKTNPTSAIRGSILSKRGSASSDILGFDDQSLERSLDSIHAFDSASHDHLEEDLDRLDFLSQSSGSVTDSKDRGKSFFGRMTKIMKNVGKKSDDSGTSSPAVKGSSGTFKPYRQRAESSLGSKDSDTDSLHLEKQQGRKTSDKAGGSFFSRLAGKKSNDKKSTAKDISPVAERNLDDSLDGGLI